MGTFLIALLLLIGFTLLIISMGNDSKDRVVQDSLEPKDAWDDFEEYGPTRYFELNSYKQQSPLELEIDYVDRNRNRTTRQIRVKRISCKEDFSDASIAAYCFMREGHREFKAG